MLTLLYWCSIFTSQQACEAGIAAECMELGTIFSDINLQGKDWTDYDKKAQESMGIYEVTYQFLKG